LEFKSYEEARSFVRSLRIRTSYDYISWSKSGERPASIPSNPNIIYGRSREWVSWGEFLGSDDIDRFRSFEDSARYIKSFNFSSIKEYKKWSSSGERPFDIPSNPNLHYKKSKEWVSWPNFLGY
jgi:hypothetical protein